MFVMSEINADKEESIILVMFRYRFYGLTVRIKKRSHTYATKLYSRGIDGEWTRQISNLWFVI